MNKPIIDWKIWHSQLVYLNYYNIVTNAKKIIKIEKIKEFIPIELYKSYMVGYQELKILQILIPKAIKFLERLYMDIERLLLVFFSNF